MPKPKKAKTTGKASPVNPAKLRAMMERSLSVTRGERRSKERRAQELVYDAMEAATPQRRFDLALAALELDPEHPDALLMALEATEFDGEELIDVLHGIVAVAAQRLGKKAFKEFVPHFWGVLDTRPYMRARFQLTEALREAGQVEEAIEEYEEMLLLNENDNLGVRYHLLPCLLALGRLDEARKLLKRHAGEGEWNAAFAWGRVLERLLSGDGPGASKALAAARKQNPHVEVYLNGQRKLPKNLPDSYSVGSKEEALCYAGPLLTAWARHVGARAWLAVQCKMDRMDKPRKN
jgi:tetratricopeptide (TPR) repeat protein